MLILILLRFNRYSSFILLILSMTVKFTNLVRSDSVGFMLIKCWYDRLLFYIGTELCIRVKSYIIRQIGNSMSLITFEPLFTYVLVSYMVHKTMTSSWIFFCFFPKDV